VRIQKIKIKEGVGSFPTACNVCASWPVVTNSDISEEKSLCGLKVLQYLKGPKSVI
jgi:hypothetical protein